MKQLSARNPCQSLLPFVYHSGPKLCPLSDYWNLTLAQAQNVSSAPLWPGKQVWSLWAPLHHFILWTQSLCEIKTVFTMMAWIWSAVWGQWQSLSVSWGLFMPQKWCQQEADQSLRVREPLHTPCSSPGNHFTVRATLGCLPFLPHPATFTAKGSLGRV